MAAIITIYTPDGKKTRTPVGYGGELCHEATKPYEKREVGTKKTPTPDADDEPAVREVISEKARQG